MKSTLRDRVIGALSLQEKELRGYIKIHERDDKAAAPITRKALEEVVELRDRYAAEGSAPLDPSAAQDVYELAERVKTIGEKSGNATAARDLKFVSGALHYIVMSTTPEIDIADGKRRFREK